eukprot:980488-Amorphochlora_amoeboformis.AAC.2
MTRVEWVTRAAVLVPAILASLSTTLVNYHVREPYMDEIFHVTQTQTYCDGKFGEWNPKITTPPGLYLVATCIAQVLSTLTGSKLSSGSIFCSLSALRWYNCFLGFISALILIELISDLHPTTTKDKDSKPITSRIRLALHACCLLAYPPFFFFLSMFYTDVGSTAAVLLTYLLSRRKYVVASAVVGAVSLVFRQTNAVWICFVVAERIIKSYETGRLDPRADLGPEIYVPTTLANLPKSIVHLILASVKRLPAILYHLAPHLLVLILFTMAAIQNGGLALGDKENHTLALHLPQTLYFSGTTLALTPIWFLFSARDLLRGLCNSGVLTVCAAALSATAIAVAMIFKGTIVHPFLLADNRHFTFYIWRRLLNGFRGYGRYLAAPVYVVSLVSMCAQLAKSTVFRSLLRYS